MKRTALTLCLCLMLAGCPVNDKPAPTPEPEPVPTPVVPTPVVVDGPSDEMKQLVAAIEPISEPELAELYNDFADVIARDTEVIKTTGHIRECHTRSGRLMFQETGIQERTPGLGEKVDAAIGAAIGMKNVPLTPELRARAVEVMKALAWACE